MMIKERFRPNIGMNEPRKETRVYYGFVIILLLTFPSISLLLFQVADAQLDLPSLDEIKQSADSGLDLPSVDEIEQSEFPPVGSTDGWDKIIEQGPSESTDGLDKIIEQGPSESTDGLDKIIEQGPSSDFTDSLIEAMDNGLDPSIAGMLGDASFCSSQNVASNIGGPVVENGFEITHTDTTCPGMSFNGPG
jgi:hypothetical protein